MEYRSKDKEFMRHLKSSIYAGIEDEDEQRYAWTYISRRVIIDDLHTYSIEKLDTEQPVVMGHGDLHTKFMVLTMKPISVSKEGKALTEAIVESGKFKHVYYTAKYKTQKVYKKDVAAFKEILDSEIKVLKPRAILCFGQVLPVDMHTVEEYLGVPVIQTHLVSTVLNEEDEDTKQELKNEIWNDVKQIRKYYKK